MQGIFPEMFKIETRRFGVSIESTFSKAIPLASVALDRLGGDLLEHFMPRGLLPEKIELIKRNDLFDYELKFSLFQGNAEFSLNSQRLRLEFLNAKGSADVETIIDMVTRSHQSVRLETGTQHIAILHSHAVFQSPADYGEFFSTKGSRWEGAFEEAGVIAYITPKNWTQQIRLLIERSFAFPDAVFVQGTTSLPSFKGAVDAETLTVASEAFNEAVTQCGLEFQPLP